MSKVRFQFRFYPTTEQERVLARVFGCCRYVANRAIEMRSTAWKNDKTHLGFKETSADLVNWKKEKEWLSEVSSVPLQQSLRHVDSAFSRFFKKQAKYPRFKKRSHQQSATYVKTGFRFSRPDPNNPNLVVSGLGRLDVKWCRDFKSTPSSITIIKRPSGKYFVSLVLSESFSQLEPVGSPPRSVGIDLGITCLATLASREGGQGREERIENPRHTRKNQARLARAQRILSRRRPGSGRWHRQRVGVARVQEHIANARKNVIEKMTTDVVRRFDIISMENLHVKGMVKNRRLSKAISDCGFGMIRSRFSDKCDRCDRYGRRFILVDRFYPSFKKCHVCGLVLDELPLSTREWTCPACGSHHDRDVNAAINLDDYHRLYPERVASPGEPKLTKTVSAGGPPVDARGGHVSHSEPSGSVCCAH